MNFLITFEYRSYKKRSFLFFFSIFFQSERGLFPNTEFVYDIELPLDFVPSNNDGEVERFELMPASRVLDLICDPQFKTTSAPVTIDFLIRKGIITIETGEENRLKIVF